MSSSEEGKRLSDSYWLDCRSLKKNSITRYSENLKETPSSDAEIDLLVPEVTDNLINQRFDVFQSKVLVQSMPSVPVISLMNFGDIMPKKSVDFKQITFEDNINKPSTSGVLCEDFKLNKCCLSENDDDLSDVSNFSSKAENDKEPVYDSESKSSHKKNTQSISLLNKKKSKKIFRLPAEAISVLKAWFSQHKSHPYPTEEEKKDIADFANISLNQVNNWFFNTRAKQKLKASFVRCKSIVRKKTRIDWDITASLDVKEKKYCKLFDDNPPISHAHNQPPNHSADFTSLNHSSDCLQEEAKKLSDINRIVLAVESASAQVIRILHFILFGMYGPIGNESILQKTKENILQFDGFLFDNDENKYFKKANSLLQLPSPLFFPIYKILMDDFPKNRTESVDTLIKFLTHPSDKFSIERNNEKLEEQKKDDDLKKRALAAHPIILLEKLDENIFEEMAYKKNMKTLKLSNENETSEKYVKPSFVQNGNGVPLKQFPEIVTNIKKARRRIINLLHSLLYGRPGSDEINRQNILEFNGFPNFPKSFVIRKTTYLNRLKSEELWQLCDTFLLRAKSGNKTKKIKKLLFFLQCPGSNQNKRENVKQLSQNSEKPNADRSKDLIDTSKINGEEISKIKLQDFESIRLNIECATPENLTELCDLLYVKPCDYSDIHQKILNFTSFIFHSNSFEFHYRKTLLHYMDFRIVKKIAGLLDIKDWESYSNKGHLAMSIMNFLMDLKLAVEKRKSDEKQKSQKIKPLILKFHSSKKGSSRSPSPDNIDSTYASEEMRLSSEENDWRNETSSYRHRHRKSGLTSKHEQILNDSTPLLEFIQHPTEKELTYLIGKILTSTSLTISMGDLVKEVLNCFPAFNLYHRIDFIKTKTLEILQELRKSAIPPDDF